MPVDSGGAVDSGAVTDAGTTADTAPPCNTIMTWPSPGAVTGVDTPSNELSATATADVLTMFFTRAGGGGVSVYQATREAGTDFANPVVLNDIATSYFGGMVPSVTGDGLTMYLAYKTYPDGGLDLFQPEAGADAGGIGFDIYRYKRASATDPFTGPERVTELASPFNDLQPAISSDGHIIVFSSDRDTDGGVSHLYQATLNGTTFGAPTQITGLFTDSTVAESYPALNAANTELYFSANPAGGFGDIYLATRATPSSNFGTAQAVSTVNSNTDDRPAFITPDECKMYLVSNHTPGGDYNIFLSKKR
jgi:hypothetical protein